MQQEEGVGREQRRRADDAVEEARALREELDRLKEARTVSDCTGFSVRTPLYLDTVDHSGTSGGSV